MYVDGVCRRGGKEGGVIREGKGGDRRFVGVKSVCSLPSLSEEDCDLLTSSVYDSISMILGEEGYRGIGGLVVGGDVLERPGG